MKDIYSYKIICNEHWRVDYNVGKKHSQRGLKGEKPDIMLIVVFLHLFSWRRSSRRCRRHRRRRSTSCRRTGNICEEEEEKGQEETR